MCLSYVQLGKAVVRSLKQREQEDLGCGDNAAHPSSFRLQFQAPFGLFRGSDSDITVKAQLALYFNPLDVKE